MQGKKIVLVSQQRSGTHALTALLSQNGILNYDEVFHPNQALKQPAAVAQLLTYLRNNSVSGIDVLFNTRVVAEKYFEYLERLHPDQAFVLDIKCNSLHILNDSFYGGSEPPQLIRILRERKYNFILLKRRNGFKRFLSEQIAAQTQQWHFERSTISPEDVIHSKVNIDIAICLKNIMYTRAQMAMAEGWIKSTGPYFELLYEDAFSNNLISQSEKYKLSEFLGVEIKNTETEFFKPKRDLSETIVNIKELREALFREGFGWMLEEGGG